MPRITSTGGAGAARAAMTEPRRRLAKTKNTVDSEDAASIGSGVRDGRPNNWDFSDWKPSSVFDERVKKGNQEREKEQSLSLESTPTQENKHRTPHTFPRTKFTANTPTSQRIALENLRQQLLFSGDEATSTDGELTNGINIPVIREGEPNNERNVPVVRGMPANYQRQDTSSGGEDGQQVAEDGPDSNQIVGRLMQIRDYLKQATVMLDNLSMSPESPESREQMNKLTRLIEHLRDQEKGYMELLQKMLAMRDETLLVMENSGESSNSKSVAESVSIDIDGRSDISEATTDRSINIRTRPKIESHMGFYSDTDGEVPTSARSNLSQISETSNNSFSETLRFESPTQLSRDLVKGTSTSTATDSVATTNESEKNELQGLRTQHELLTKMLAQQKQLKALQERQAELLQLQRNAEQRLVDRTAELNEAREAAESYKEVADHYREASETSQTAQSDTEGTLTDNEVVPQELKDLRKRLAFLRNIYAADTQSESMNQSVDEGNTSTMESEQSFAAAERAELKDKLRDLQTKKARMDDLLQELQSLRTQRYQQLHNDLDGDKDSTTSSQRRISESIAATASANQTADTANEVLEVLDAKSKMKKLQEVRNRLSQLRDLVQYYQSGTEFIHADGEEQSSLPAYSDYEDPDLMRNLREMQGKGSVAAKLQEYAQRQGPLTQEEEQSMVSEQSEADTEGDTTETESHLSSNLGALGDDPEIQEKVRKLRAAKEKLKRLQELVAMVQQSPDAARVLPDDLAELAASMDDGDTTSQATATSDKVPGFNVPSGDSITDRNTYYEMRMSQQQSELEDLMVERTKLLAIQDQLQKLQEQFPVLRTPRQDGSEPVGIQKEVKNTETNSVTFDIPDDVPSNDELWDKMRSQRMLREELRQKKRELEAMMKKDRNKKSYFRNQPQDNQSDTVSFSDQLGTSMVSGDVTTMATWGGSTTDNLAEIYEDDGASEDQAEIEDDGYPDDGIVQVEEEEEEQDSDKETYTIEDDYRARQRDRPISLPVVDTSPSGARGVRPKVFRHTYDPQDPRSSPLRSHWMSPNHIYSAGWPRFSPRRQENYRSAPDIVNEEGDGDERVSSLRDQLERTTSLCQSLLQDQQALSDALQGATISGDSPYRSSLLHNLMSQHQAQLQQQQLMFSLNQCYSQLYAQQGEIRRQQEQIQHLIQQTETDIDNLNMDDSDANPYASGAYQRPMSAQSPWNPYVSAPYPSPFMSPYASPGMPMYPPMAGFYNQPFNFSPQFPSNFNSPFRSASADQDVGRQYSTTGQQTESPQGATARQPMFVDRAAGGTPTRGYMASSHPTKPAKLPVQAQPVEVPKLNLEEILRRRYRSRRANARDSSARSQQSMVSETSSQQVSNRAYPPFNPFDQPGHLSGGISGTAFMDNASMSSVMSSIRDKQEAIARATSERSESYRESDAPSEFSLFEALRETIYSEVATLISQNENRPHFLIELFRELQMLSSDYLRQRALYAIQDLVTRFLTEETASESISAPPPPWLNQQNITTGSEHTPSESLITTDEEEVKARLMGFDRKYALNMHRDYKHSLVAGSVKSDCYDYVETVDSQSSMSTPPSGHWESPFAQDSLGDTVIHLDKDDYLAALANQSPFSTLSMGDSPFAQDSLGDTVIHFDKAMQRMREYERKLKEQEAKEQAGPSRQLATDTASEVTSSSAQDQGSESSVSDVPYPRIDTQQLDRQIKGIMTEVIPVLKEHMDDVCSQQLLSYIKRLVLTLTKQRDDGQEFVRFFHKQLGSILQDSLSKFEGRKMRECGEDLLVDMSEILFNELAFFRLMQDLDDPKIKSQARQKWTARGGGDTETSTETSVDVGDQDNQDTTTQEGQSEVDDEDLEEDELGKERDDELANATEIKDTPSKMKIELSVSETKPFTRIGSDEDEDDEDESCSMEDPSETAVSRDLEMEKSSETVVEAERGAGDGAGSPFKDGGAAVRASSPQKGDVVVNGEVDTQEVTIEDLPEKLTSLTPAELQDKIGEEKAEEAAAVLDSMPQAGQGELAGDGDTLKEPDQTSTGGTAV